MYLPQKEVTYTFGHIGLSLAPNEDGTAGARPSVHSLLLQPVWEHLNLWRRGHTAGSEDEVLQELTSFNIMVPHPLNQCICQCINVSIGVQLTSPCTRTAISDAFETCTCICVRKTSPRHCVAHGHCHYTKWLCYIFCTRNVSHPPNRMYRYANDHCMHSRFQVRKRVLHAQCTKDSASHRIAHGHWCYVHVTLWLIVVCLLYMEYGFSKCNWICCSTILSSYFFP